VSRGLCGRHGERAFAGRRRQGHGVVGSRLVGNVYAIANKDGKRSVKVLASGLYRPNGVAFSNGTLYIAELSKVSKIEKVEDSLDSPPKLTTICRRTKPTAGSSSLSDPTTSSMSRWASPATTSCMTMHTVRSGG